MSWACSLQFLVVKKRKAKKNHTVDSNNMGLSYTGQFMQIFFNSKHNTTQSVVGWICACGAMDTEKSAYKGAVKIEEAGIQRANCKFYTNLQQCWGSSPLTALLKNALCFFTHKTFIEFKFQHPPIKFYWSTVTPMHFLVLSVAAFAKQQICYKVATETAWPTKLKIFTVWPFIEKVCQPLT